MGFCGENKTNKKKQRVKKITFTLSSETAYNKLLLHYLQKQLIWCHRYAEKHHVPVGSEKPR